MDTARFSPHRTLTNVWRVFAVLFCALTAAAMLPSPPSRAADPAAPASNVKLEVIVLVDNSSLVAGKVLPDMQAAISSYMTSLPPEAKVGVVRYGGFPSIAYGLSTNRTAAVAAVAGLEPDGQPALFDGVDLAIEQFTSGTFDKRQILLVGTGVNVGSTLTLADVRIRLLQKNIRVDALSVAADRTDPATIGAISSMTSGLRIALGDATSLKQLSSSTVVWATPAAIARPSKLSGSFLKSPIVLGLGILCAFAGLAVVAWNGVSAKGTKKVDLLGASDVTDLKAPSTAVGSLAGKMADAADKVLEKQGKNRSLGASLERAGIALRPGEFLVVCLGAILGFFALVYKLKGLTVATGATAVFIIFGPKTYIKRRGAKRSSAFGDQLSDTLQLLSSSLRAGQGLMQAVDSVAREGEKPASEEFKRVVTETRLGRDLIDSLRAMSDRVRSEDFNWVIPAIEINREVGGDLAEVLDTVAGTIRDRADIRRQVKTLSAEGKLSAYVLLSLPVGIALFINISTPEYLAELKHNPGYYLAGGAVLLMVIGGTWLFKICKIDF